jgi:hypothetical protein
MTRFVAKRCFTGATYVSAVLFLAILICWTIEARRHPSDPDALSGNLVYALIISWFFSLFAISISYIAWRRTVWSLATIIAPLPIIVVFSLLAMFWGGAFGGPGPSIASFRANGKTIHLTIEPIPTDTVYALWKATGPTTLVWRQIRAPLTYSEDGSFIGEERLALSADRRMLLVGRGGIWTDCLLLSADLLESCAPYSDPAWDDPDYREMMTARSDEIAQIAGRKP